MFGARRASSMGIWAVPAPRSRIRRGSDSGWTGRLGDQSEIAASKSVTNCALTAEWSIASYSRASCSESISSGSRMRFSIECNSLGLDHDLSGKCSGFSDRAFFLQAMGGGGIVEWHDPADLRFDCATCQPAVDHFSGRPLLFGSRVENRKPEDLAILRIQRTDGKRRACFAPCDKNHPPARGEERDRHLE